jgi:hypothetical protein
MPKSHPTYKYELIDNHSGDVLVSSFNRAEGLSLAAQYIRNNNIDFRLVSWVIIANGYRATIIHRTTGAALGELLEDEGTYDLEDEDW